MNLELHCQPLTATAFAPFGAVLETTGHGATSINHGLTDKYAQLARLAVDEGAQLQAAIYRSRPVALPYPLLELERHPLACQLFMPLDGRPFPIVVAASTAAPRPGELHAFMSDGRQGVCLHPGTWHHHQLSLGAACDYLVIERIGEAGNIETVALPPGMRLCGLRD